MKTKKTTRPRAKTAKRCRHRDVTYLANTVGDWAGRRCDDCGVTLSLGSSNDEPEAVRVEMRAAKHLGDAAGDWPLADVWDMGGGTLAFGDSAHLPETWPWDPTRPVAGQYEECVALQAWPYPLRSMEHPAGWGRDLDAIEYEHQRRAEPDCRDEDGPEVERLMADAIGYPCRATTLADGREGNASDGEEHNDG